MKKILIISLTLFSFASGAKVYYGNTTSGGHTRYCAIDGGNYTCGCQDTEAGCAGQITAVYCGSETVNNAQCQIHTANGGVWEGVVISPPQKLQEDK